MRWGGQRLSEKRWNLELGVTLFVLFLLLTSAYGAVHAEGLCQAGFLVMSLVLMGFWVFLAERVFRG